MNRSVEDQTIPDMEIEQAEVMDLLREEGEESSIASPENYIMTNF